MAWSARWPVVNTDCMWDWRLVKELIQGVQERANLAAKCDWPSPTKIFFDGFVIGATATTVTLSQYPGGSPATFCVNGTPSSTVYSDPWFCITDSPTSQNPGHNGAYPWFLNIDDNDPAKNFTVPIQSNNTAGVVTVPNLSDFWTSNQLTGTPFTSLIGKRATITGWGYALWWAQRNWGSEWPNDREYAFGVVPQYTGEHDSTGALLPDSPATSFMRDDTKSWTPNEHVGRDLLVYSGTDGLLKRVTITSNTKNTLFWSAQTWIPKYSQPYCVVAAGARAYPGRQDPSVFAWTRTVREGFLTHNIFTDSDPMGALMPISTIKFDVGGPDGTCTTFNQKIYDYDYTDPNPIEDGDLACGTQKQAGKIWNPDLYKQIHGLQLACEDLSWLYVEAKDYTGINGLPKINPAELFRIANINWQSVTTGNVVGASGDDGSINNQINVTGFTLPTGMAYPIDVHYSVRHADGTLNGGYGQMISATVLQAVSGFTFQQRLSVTSGGTTTVTEHDSGKTLIVSLGWTRFVFRRVKRVYSQTGFIPDYQVVDGVTSVFGTPVVSDFTHTGCTGVGSYQKRAKSDHYIERKQDVGDPNVRQGFAWEGTDASTAFNANDVAIFVGDGPFDPSISSSGAPETGHVIPEMAPYYDHFYNGLLNDAHQYAANRQRWGTVTAGGTFYLQDTTKNWFDHIFFTVGPNGTRMETGTASSGSTTSLTDSSKLEPNPSSPTNPLHCFWNMSRFLGFTGPWVGFTVEVDIPDPITGNMVTYKRLITSGNATTCTVSWNEPLPQSAAGHTYRIKEVYILNRYAERTLKIIKADGSSVLTPIVGNCEDTLFFTPVTGLTVDSTMKYQIIEVLPGTTIQRDPTNTFWQPPTGHDAVRKGVTSPVDFVGPTQNLAFIQKRYGRFMDRDIICPLVYNELYQVLNALRWVRYDVTFTSNDDNNEYASYGDTDPIVGDGDSCPKAQSYWGINGSDPPTGRAGSIDIYNGAPYANSQCDFDGEYAQTHLSRAYAYAQFTIPCLPIRFAFAVDFWSRAKPPCVSDPSSNLTCSFDAMGDPVANGTFVKWNAQAAAQQAFWQSAPLGSLGLPPCVACVDSGSPRHIVSGWELDVAYGIAKGDVVGGFTQINRTDGL